MGLDGVELILAVEESFGIQIANEEAATLFTVGDLYKFIAKKVPAPDLKTCMTSAVFYRMRRGIETSTGVNRRDIRPTTLLADLMPRKRRRECWLRTQQAINLKLPRLRHADWIQLIFIVAGITLAVSWGVDAGYNFGTLLPFSILGFLIGGLFVALTPWLAIELPNNVVTVGDLAKDVLAINYGRLASDIGSGSPKELWEALRRIIVIQTAVPIEKITQESRFVDDLGIN